jgi:hypothetical protein
MSDTCFLNVDLDVLSRRRLEPLASALERRGLFVHYVGPEGSRQGAHFSLTSIAGVSSADTLMQKLAGHIAALPPTVRVLWDNAASRTFNVGIQAGVQPPSHEVCIASQTVALVAALGAQVVITTYSAEVLPPGPNRTPAAGAAPPNPGMQRTRYGRR